MADRSVLVNDLQFVTPAEYNNLQSYLAEAIERLVLDAVGDGSYYSGFTATEDGTWGLDVAPGRLYLPGGVYRSDAVVSFDMFASTIRPSSQKRWVGIVGWGKTIAEDNIQERNFLVSAQSDEIIAKPTPLLKWNKAEINTILGAIAAEPVMPTPGAGQVLIARVLLSTGGIEKVIMEEPTRVPQAARNLLLLMELDAWRNAIESDVASLRSDLALLGQDVQRRALRSRVDLHEMMLVALQQGSARNWEAIQRLAQEQASTSAFLLQDYEGFVNDAKSDTDHVDYSARVGGGLFFPYAASGAAAGGIAPLDPTDPKVSIVNDMMTPKRAVASRRFLTGQGLGSFANTQQFSVVTNTKKKMTQWRDASHYGSGPAEYKYTTFKGVPGVTWAAQSNKPTRPHGYAGEGGGVSGWTMARYDETAPGSGTYTITWVKTYEAWEEHHYFVDEATTTTKDSQGRAQSILNANGGWLQSVTFWTDVGGAGDVDVIVCRCDENGQPDLQRILSETTVPSASVAAGANQVAVEPVYVNPGQFFAVVIMTTGAYAIEMADHGVSNGQHYALLSPNSFGVPGAEGDNDLRLELEFATYDASVVYVDLEPLSLAGGIDSVGFNTDIVVPPNCAVHFEVQHGGTWYRMQPGQTTAGMDWSQQPNLLPFRAVFKGTKDAMPSIGIGPRSSLIVGRAATSFVHISEPIDVGAGNTTSEVRVRVRVDHFDEAVHDLTIALIVGGAPLAATAVEDVQIDGDSMHRTAVFNAIMPATQAFQVRLDGSVTDLSNLFTPIDRYTYAAA